MPINPAELGREGGTYFMDLEANPHPISPIEGST